MNAESIERMLPLRMAELGFGDGWRTEWHTAVFQPSESRVIVAWNAWLYIPVESFGAASGLVVESDAAITDLASFLYRENAHEHTGRVEVHNQSSYPASLTYIIAYPD